MNPFRLSSMRLWSMAIQATNHVVCSTKTDAMAIVLVTQNAWMAGKICKMSKYYVNVARLSGSVWVIHSN